MTKDFKKGMAIGAAVTLGAEVIVGGITAVVKVIQFKKILNGMTSDLDKEFENDNDDEELFEDTNK